VATANRSSRAVVHTEFEDIFTLGLTAQEAHVLMQVCSRIGGSPEGLRGIFSDEQTSIMCVLRDAGVEDYTIDENKTTFESGSAYVGNRIYFKGNTR
jgi:hypothetical protein